MGCMPSHQVGTNGARNQETPQENGHSDRHVKQILLGNTEEAVQKKANLIRLFISSTFTDTQQERNTLMTKAYPTLKSFCKQLGYEFQVVDMRWGIREEAENDHMATELCMREIRACQTLSVGASFVMTKKPDHFQTLLSHKYGSRPLPRTILAEHFEQIFEASSEEERQLLGTWYLKDDNAIPAEFVLQRVSSIYPDFLSSNQEREFTARLQWWTEAALLQDIIRNGILETPGAGEMHQFSISVTEKEIQQGILEAENSKQSCLWFRRTLSGIDNAKPSIVLSKFKEPDADNVRELMSDLQTRMRQKLSDDHIVEYRVPWTEDGINPAIPEHKEYLDQLCEDFTSKVQQITLSAVGERRDSIVHNELHEEVAAHAWFCKSKCNSFCGRSEALSVIDVYLKSMSQCPLIIVGQSGSGKTSLMAMAAKRAWDVHGGQVAVVHRFIGTTLACSSVRPLLTSIVTQIMRIYRKETAEPRAELKYLVEDFRISMACANEKRPLVIILDSLDQLDSVDGGRHLFWLPRQLPPHVHMILSTLPQEGFGCLPRLKGLYSDHGNFFIVPEMKKEDMREILLSWFAREERTLTKAQTEAAIHALAQCPLPLFLKLTFDWALRWHSYVRVEETVWTDNVGTAIELLFRRLENTHGRPLVRTALACITISESGLSEGEIEDILSLDEEVLNDVYQWWTPPVRRLPPLIWVRVRNELQEYLVERGVDGTSVVFWYHRQFVETAKNRYLKSAENQFRYHLALAEFFLGIWADRPKPFVDKNRKESSAKRHVSGQPLRYENGDHNLRKLNQLPFHLIGAGELTALKTQCFFNYEFLLAKLLSASHRTLFIDLKRAVRQWPEDLELRLLMETLQLSQDALLSSPTQLGGQLLARIHRTNSATLIAQAKDLIEQGKLPAEAFPVLNLLEAFEIRSAEKTKNLTSLLTQASKPAGTALLPLDTCLIPPRGQLMHKLSGHIDTVTDLDICRDGRFVVTGSLDNTIKVWDVKQAELLQTVEFAENVGFAQFCHDDAWVAASCWKREICIVDVDIGTTISSLRGRSNKDHNDLCMPITTCTRSDGSECVVAMRNVEMDLWSMGTCSLVHTAKNRVQDWSSHHLGTGIDQRLLVSAKHFVAYAGYRSHQFFIMNADKPSNHVEVTLFEAHEFDKKSEVPDHCSALKEHISALCVHNQGDYVLACNGLTRSVHLCSTADGHLVRLVAGDRSLGKIHNFHLPPCSDDWLYFLTKNMVGLWNIKTEAMEVMLAHPCRVCKVVGVDEKIVVTIAEDGVLRIWDRKRPPYHHDLSLFTGEVRVESDSAAAEAGQMFRSLIADVAGEEALRALSLTDSRSLLTTQETLNYWTEPGSDDTASDSPCSKFHSFDNSRYIGVSQSHPRKGYVFAFSIWDLNCMSCVRRIFFQERSVQIHHVVDDENLLVTEGSEMKLLSLTSWKMCKTFPGRTSESPNVTFLKNRREIIAETEDRPCLKLFDVDSGRIVGTLVPSKKSAKEYLSGKGTASAGQFMHLQVSKNQAIVCGCLKGKEIFVWSVAERVTLHVLTPSELLPGPKDAKSFLQFSHFLADSGKFVVVVQDHPKEADCDNSRVGVLCVESGAKQFGITDGGKLHETDSDGEILSVLRLNKTKNLQLLALNQTGRATILCESETSIHNNRHKFTETRARLVTWSTDHKGRTVTLWEPRKAVSALQPLGYFTPDQLHASKVHCCLKLLTQDSTTGQHLEALVTDVALLDGGNTVLVDSATGPVQLQLRGTDAPAPGDASAAAVLFAGVELNMRYAGENGGQ